jgi:hypothetical protein
MHIAHRLLSAAALATTLSALPVLADTVKFSGPLAATNEVPANASTGTGTLQASLDKDSGKLTWTVSYAGLTGPAKAAHFHGPAPAGQNAGVTLGFSGALDSPIQGSAMLTPAQVADLLAGKWYVNIHTAANPGGEIRGQASVTP